MLLAGPVLGQSTRTLIILNGGSNQVTNATTNVINSAAIFIPGQTVGVELAATLTGAVAHTNTSSDTVTLETSVTGTNWTANAFRLSLTINGTNSSSATSSSTVGGIPFIRVANWEHPGSSPGTNLFIAIYRKDP